MRKRTIFKRIPLFWTVVLTFAGIYLFLLFVVPYLSMLMTGRNNPLPVPATLMAIYLALAAIGLLVYLAADETRMKEFLEPVDAFLRGPGKAQNTTGRLLAAGRWVLLAVIPLLAGWVMYNNVAPSVNPPTALRSQHPTIPFSYEKLTNPFRHPDGSVDQAVLDEGRLLYQINCRPCHGTPAAGDGPLAYGFRLRPANFRSEDTIATVIEAYAFWRVKEGGIGLPAEGSPWDSAMPAWKDELSDEQIWKIIAAEYSTAGVQPRRPEAAPKSALPALPAAGGAALASAPLASWSSTAAQAPASGEQIYKQWCSFCHGDAGDGKGPVAAYLYPRPRDFTSAMFKFRTTASGELPLRQDVINIVQRGVHDTAMPRWEGILSQADMETVVDYITKTFVPDWGTYDPTVIAIPKPPPVTSAMVAEGKQIYQDLQCWKCHGQSGRSTGASAPTLKDDQGFPIHATNLTQAWKLKGGSQLADIYTRFSTGVNGTPMPSFYDVFPEEQREAKLWALSAYVRSLQEGQPDGASVVKAHRISGALPSTPDDPAWLKTQPVSFYLTGQAIVGPRWQNPGVSAVTVRALHNDQNLAMLVEWDDPNQDKSGSATPPEAGESGGDTYVNLEKLAQEQGAYVDALAVQFPQAVSSGTQKPYLLWGQTGQPVNIWKWQADGSMAEYNAAGIQGGLKPQDKSQVTVQAAWVDGKYRLVLTRALNTGNPDDIAMVPGEFIPLAFQAWDGSSKEVGARMSLSSWYSLWLEKPAPVSAYLYTGLTVLLVAAAEWLLARRARRSSPLENPLLNGTMGGAR